MFEVCPFQLVLSQLKNWLKLVTINSTFSSLKRQQEYCLLNIDISYKHITNHSLIRDIIYIFIDQYVISNLHFFLFVSILRLKSESVNYDLWSKPLQFLRFCICKLRDWIKVTQEINIRNKLLNWVTNEQIWRWRWSKKPTSPFFPKLLTVVATCRESILNFQQVIGQMLDIHI